MLLSTKRRLEPASHALVLGEGILVSSSNLSQITKPMLYKHL